VTIRRQLKELFRKEMLVLLRDRQTILLLFLMPVALIFFLSLAMKGVYIDKVTGQKVMVVVENASLSPKSLKLEERLAASPIIERIARPRNLDNDRLFERGAAQATVLIPKDFEDGSHPVELQFDPILDAGYRIALKALISGLTMEVVLDTDNLENIVSNFLVEKTKKNREFPSPLQQSVPGWTIFAMFFIAIPMSIGFLREKNDGTLQRLFTYPVNPNLVAMGKVIPYYLINGLQFVLMLLVGFYVMPKVVGLPFGLGEHPWQLVPITVLTAAAATGFGVLIASTAKTPEQASTLASTLSVLMGVFGGIMVPHVVMPLFMKKLAMISPMYWAHQAYLDVLLREASFTVILPKLIVLAVFAGICFYIAGRRVRWI
jgi:ABC-2 type transport system permease protein